MKYLVVEIRYEELGFDDDANEPIQAFDTAVHPCEDTRAVHAAIKNADRAGHNWSVFEMVGSRAKRRAVIFQMDGSRSYDVEIS